MRKKNICIICTLILMILLLTVGCNVTGNAKEAQKETKPAVLEVHFGNGEIYKCDIAYIYFPDDSLAIGSNVFDTSSLHGKYFDPSKMSIEEIQNSGAKLSNGCAYSFSEAFALGFDKKTKTVSIYLWREEPYRLEKEVFEKVEEN